MILLLILLMLLLSLTLGRYIRIRKKNISWVHEKKNESKIRINITRMVCLLRNMKLIDPSSLEECSFIIVQVQRNQIPERRKQGTISWLFIFDASYRQYLEAQFECPFG